MVAARKMILYAISLAIGLIWHPVSDGELSMHINYGIQMIPALYVCRADMDDSSWLASARLHGEYVASEYNCVEP